MTDERPPLAPQRPRDDSDNWVNDTRTPYKVPRASKTFPIREDIYNRAKGCLVMRGEKIQPLCTEILERELERLFPPDGKAA